MGAFFQINGKRLCDIAVAVIEISALPLGNFHRLRLYIIALIILFPVHNPDAVFIYVGILHIIGPDSWESEQG